MVSLRSTLLLLLLLLLLFNCHFFSFISAQQQCGGGTLCANNLCCSQYGYCGDTSDYCGSGCQSGPCTSGAGSAPSGSGSVSSIITPSIFDQFLSQRSASGGFYTYDAFVAAAANYGAFGTSGGSDVANKQELAAFFANVAHETDSGYYVEEINKDANYCNPEQWPCASGKLYYGRGPLQLSWNYNYGAAGEVLAFDGINDPDIVARDATISFETAVWFWMTQQSPTCHDAMVNDQGFGATIRAINGAKECGNGPNVDKKERRIAFYKSFCTTLGVDPGSNLSC